MKNVDELAVNTLRFLAVDAIEKAKSGHPGLPLGAAPMAYALWSRFLKHNPANPEWFNRDRFVLSAGHGSMLLYGLLYLFGYGLSLDDLKNFRQWGSKTPGHPEYGHTPGVETTTGPLGQGFANAVGMALAEKRLGAEFNREGYPVIDHFTYCLAGDGCMMEGITYEAASLAGHLKLGKLVCLYDDNKITIDGNTDLTFTEDVEKRFMACGWQVLKVEDGNELELISSALEEAGQENSRPSLIMVKTQIGFGCPQKQGKSEVHGAPVGEEEVKRAKENLNWPGESTFYVPAEVEELFRDYSASLQQQEKEWHDLMKAYESDYPDLSARFHSWVNGEIPEELEKELARMSFEDSPATRAASGQIMQAVARYLPNLVGGSADLNASAKTYLKGMEIFQSENPAGNNIYFGVREHAMGGILSGIDLHGGLRPFGSTFLVFCDYMKPAIRLAALMKLGVIYVFSHDSIAVGEDGPTHQPAEQIPNLRSIPHLTVLRPADAIETAYAWLSVINNREGPSALILSRQGLPQLAATGEESLKGGYIVRGEDKNVADIMLIASGSELHLALEAQVKLKEKGIEARVISMMSIELFMRQSKEYRESVIPSDIKKRLIIEAALPQGWEQFAGDEGQIIALDDFGASAPGKVMLEKKGFTVDNVVDTALNLLA